MIFMMYLFIGAFDAFQTIQFGERFARNLLAPLRPVEGGTDFTAEEHYGILVGELQELIDAAAPVAAGA